jgi:hypothetical protein
MAYVDSDPVFTQIKLASEDPVFRQRLDAHDVHFTFGERAPSPLFETGHQWRPTRQPILLDAWRPSPRQADVFTTVMSWTSYAPLVHAGRTYGQKDMEFERFLGLPARVCPLRLEVAVGGLQHKEWEIAPAAPSHEAPAAGGALAADVLRRYGWSVIDPLQRCRDLDTYRDYIRSSMGEWSVAKNGYVQGRSGWFSCRSACYLASGRPVVVQNTGFDEILPVGRGIIPFSSLDEAADALREVAANYECHAKAARDVAAGWFDSDHVLNRLLESACN